MGDASTCRSNNSLHGCDGRNQLINSWVIEESHVFDDELGKLQMVWQILDNVHLGWVELNARAQIIIEPLAIFDFADLQDIHHHGKLRCIRVKSCAMSVLDNITLIDICELDGPHVLFLKNSFMLLMKSTMLPKGDFSDLGILRCFQSNQARTCLLGVNQSLASNASDNLSGKESLLILARQRNANNLR